MKKSLIKLAILSLLVVSFSVESFTQKPPMPSDATVQRTVDIPAEVGLLVMGVIFFSIARRRLSN
ncbi:MAG TPA: hypothetical protein DCO68_06100 [Methylophilaceae bacterium]|nr:hypothetical protein [Methylophilaceae bacterium]HAJ71635.1 hypothetical protein [Methylophilaceae bacterium]